MNEPTQPFDHAPIRVFLDTEFTGLHRYTSLISIGLVADNGYLFYAELTDYDRTQVGPWLAEHVLPLLSGNLRRSSDAKVEDQMLLQGNIEEISPLLRDWFAQLGESGSVEIWADVLAWDWVLFCDLFGNAFDIPPQIHYMPCDLSTLLRLKGHDPDIRREDLGKVTFEHPSLKLAKHHALYDALLEKAVYDSLMQ